MKSMLREFTGMHYSRMGKPPDSPTLWRSFTLMFPGEASIMDDSYRECAEKLHYFPSNYLYLLVLSFCIGHQPLEIYNESFSCRVYNVMSFDFDCVSDEDCGMEIG